MKRAAEHSIAYRLYDKYLLVVQKGTKLDAKDKSLSVECKGSKLDAKGLHTNFYRTTSNEWLIEKPMQSVQVLNARLGSDLTKAPAGGG